MTRSARSAGRTPSSVSTSSLANCRRSLRLYQQLNNPLGEASTWDSIGYAYPQLGRQSEAIGCFRRSLNLLHRLGDRLHLADVSVRLGDAYHASGQPELARESWQSAWTSLSTLNHPQAAAVRTKLDRM